MQTNKWMDRQMVYLYKIQENLWHWINADVADPDLRSASAKTVRVH